MSNQKLYMYAHMLVYLLKKMCVWLGGGESCVYACFCIICLSVCSDISSHNRYLLIKPAVLCNETKIEENKQNKQVKQQYIYVESTHKGVNWRSKTSHT